MQYIKKILLIAALLALLIGCFAFSVSAVTDDTVSIVYGDLSLSFNAEGCETWQDVVDANDNNMSGGLFIDSKNRVYYYWFDMLEEKGPYYVCNDMMDVQYADDPISTDEIYTFNHITLSFGDLEFEKTLWSASLWLDLAGYSDLDDGLQINSAGRVIFNHEGLTYYVYTQTGDPVNESDDVTNTHYQLMLEYMFTIEEYSSTGPTGVKYTVSGLVPSLNLYDLVDSSVNFESDLFAVLGYFDFTADGSIALYDDSSLDAYYLFNDDGLLHELQSSCYYSMDSCSVGVHDYKKLLFQKQPTCTEDGFIRYQCNRCTEVQDQVLPARGHYIPYTFTVIMEPTCTETGLKARVCDRCDAACEQTEVPALGHNRDLFGICKLCGDNAVGNWWNGLWNPDESGSSGSAGGSSSGSDEKPWYEDLFDKITGGDDGEDPFAGLTDTLNGWKEKLSEAGKSLLALAVGIALIPLIVLLFPLLKAIVKGITFIVNSLVDLFKDLSEALSRKAKKK